MPQIRSICVRLIGSVQERAVGRAVALANSVQSGIQFEYQPRRTPLTRNFRLPNGAWDLVAAAARLVKNDRRPTIFYTAEPFGDPDNATDRDYLLYWDSLRYYGRPDVFVVSSHLWTKLFLGELPDPYFLLAMASTLVEMMTGRGSHVETRNCLMDECDDPTDLANAFDGNYPWLCDDCESFVAQHVGASITPHQLGSIRRLRQRAVGKKLCFVAMPFKTSMSPVFKSIKRGMEQQNWTVVREDEHVLRRRILESIYQGITSSDVVVADVTEPNENVFYEIGLAHAWKVETILVQRGQRPLPFDLHNQRRISYSRVGTGLAKMARALARHAGNGRYRD